jgi:hypothetical protein
MNKSDLKLVIIILLIALSFYAYKIYFNSDEDKKALVYYENRLVKTIILTTPGKEEFIVKGYNGDILIEVENSKVRVKKETSPLHICSKQGWVSNANDILVCLPNKVVIKIVTNKEDIDAIVR